MDERILFTWHRNVFHISTLLFLNNIDGNFWQNIAIICGRGVFFKETVNFQMVLVKANENKKINELNFLSG
jgi:hypothetical protein